MMDVVDQTKVLWPVVGQAGRTQDHSAALRAHASVCHYASQLRPYKGELSEIDDDDDSNVTLWTEMIGSLMVGDKAEPVALSSLQTLESREVSVSTEEKDELRGRTQDYQRLRVLLPVTVSRRAFNQLELVVKELGFMPDVKNTKQTIYRVKRPEEYDEPIRDDIPKPQ